MSNYDRSPGRRRAAVNRYQAEDQALSSVAREAEGKLAERRAARQEARVYRMRELETQAKAMDDQSDRIYRLTASTTNSGGAAVDTSRSSVPRTLSRSRDVVGNSSSSSAYGIRRGSGDTNNAERAELKDKFNDSEKKLKLAMLQNAQLDNEKSILKYQVELLKDSMEEVEIVHTQLKRENRKTNNDLQFLKRDFEKATKELEIARLMIDERDRLIQDHNLVLVGGEKPSTPGDDAESRANNNSNRNSQAVSNGKLNNNNNNKHLPDMLDDAVHLERPGGAALISKEAARILDEAGAGSLDKKLRLLAEAKDDLNDQVRRMKMELDEERQKAASRDDILSKGIGSLRGNDAQLVAAAQKEATQRVQEYKLKLQNAEQQISTLNANVVRLEQQVKRFKTIADKSEASEEELKKDKRNLQKEIRDAQEKITELSTDNEHLQKRLDKLNHSKAVQVAAAVAASTTSR